MSRKSRFCSTIALFGCVAALLLAPIGAARADSTSTSSTANPKLFKICKDQTYALCLVAGCTVFNGVSYCGCDVKQGDSISLPFNFDKDQDVCTVNAAGAANGYMVSMFSLPKSVSSRDGNKALYDCPAGSSTGSYAQCDGGICFKGSEGQSFPGFDKPLAKDQIVCSCPITKASATAKHGYQIEGPYPCQDSYFANCKSATGNARTGSPLYSGAPAGSANYLSHVLYGGNPTVNTCHPPGAAAKAKSSG